MALHVDHVLYHNELPADCITECASSGDVTEAVEFWRQELGFTVDRDRAVRCLTGYGIEDVEEKDDDELAQYVLWLACGDFKEWDGTEDSPCGSDIFCLE